MVRTAVALPLDGPIAIGFLVKKLETKRAAAWLRGLLMVLTAWLLGYNITLFISYLV